MPKKLMTMEQIPTDGDGTSLDQLAQRLNADWSHLRRAREAAEAKREELRRALHEMDSEDTSIVVSGSLARNEFTSGSDIDWTLLIDGSADPKHYDLTTKIDNVIRGLSTKVVGQEGTFGAMVFSHDLDLPPILTQPVKTQNPFKGELDLPPILTQPVKTQNPFKGELSHGIVEKDIHEGVQAGRRAAFGARDFHR